MLKSLNIYNISGFGQGIGFGRYPPPGNPANGILVGPGGPTGIIGRPPFGLGIFGSFGGIGFDGNQNGIQNSGQGGFGSQQGGFGSHQGGGGLSNGGVGGYNGYNGNRYGDNNGNNFNGGPYRPSINSDKPSALHKSAIEKKSVK